MKTKHQILLVILWHTACGTLFVMDATPTQKESAGPSQIETVKFIFQDLPLSASDDHDDVSMKTIWNTNSGVYVMA